MPAFDNYISFGSARLLTDPAYMAAIVDMVSKVLEVCVLSVGCVPPYRNTLISILIFAGISTLYTITPVGILCIGLNAYAHTRTPP